MSTSATETLLRAIESDEELLPKDKFDYQRTSPEFYIRNWAGIHACRPRYMHFPESEPDIRRVLTYARARGERVRVIGSLHSPSDIAMCSGHIISLGRFNRVLEVDTENCLITVQAGIQLREIVRVLHSRGLALSVLGSITDQSLAGALSTATHGTGVRFGPLGASVVTMRLMDASGQVHECNSGTNAELFEAAKVGLGCMGVILECTLKVEKSFRLHAVQQPEKLSFVLSNLQSLIHSAEHARFWWFPHTDMTVVWRANRTYEPAQCHWWSERRTQSSFFWSVLTFLPRIVWRACDWIKNRLIAYHSFEASLFLGRFFPSIIPWLNRFYRALLFNSRTESVCESFDAFTFDCLFKQYVNEWAIPVEKCAEALTKLRAMLDKRGLKVHLPVEVRFVASDTALISPAYGRLTCYIGIIMYKPYGYDVPFREYSKEYENIMFNLGGRPHWAKEFSIRPRHFKQLYPRWDDWLAMRRKMDPQGLFVNEYVRRTCLSDD
eukprot:950434_1